MNIKIRHDAKLEINDKSFDIEKYNAINIINLPKPIKTQLTKITKNWNI